MAKLQIVIKGQQSTVHADEGFAGNQCINIQDLVGGHFQAKGAKLVAQAVTANADHDREEAVPEHVTPR